MIESSVTLRLAPPNYVVCADLVVCLGYSSTGVSAAFSQCPSYTMIVKPSQKRGVAVVDVTDAKNWLEKKSGKNPKAHIVSELLSNADFSQDVVVIPPETHTQVVTSENVTETTKITTVDDSCKKQAVSVDAPCSFVEMMAELKECRRQSALRVAELNQRRVFRAQIRQEIMEAKAEIEFYLKECT